ncbi:MAG TPA: hypothetical protein VEY09_18855 [Pyrinomonadaceae bacterium]|nr:hypothetical protein [Pyrinomonadaceae bacterium]
MVEQLSKETGVSSVHVSAILTRLGLEKVLERAGTGEEATVSSVELKDVLIGVRIHHGYVFS